ncbi:hypothetical protein [Psychrobacillus sp. L4]|uniref:hypothetical protein n=1 Tax=Psychrobacillus sp. L4 TaxID=3236892 RepID=UPI0036F40764
MLDNFIDTYYKQKAKKGYEVIGKKLTILFMGDIFAIIAVFIYSIISKDLIVLFITPFLFITVFIINKKIDGLLMNYFKRSAPELKQFVLNYLKITLGFNHSSQYKEFSVQLQHKGEKNMKSYNFYPQLTMILTVILFLGTLIVQVYQEYLIGIIIFAIIITLIVLFINPTVNQFVSLFRNGKPQKMIELASFINEIYLDKLIEENVVKEIQPDILGTLKKSKKRKGS